MQSISRIARNKFIVLASAFALSQAALADGPTESSSDFRWGVGAFASSETSTYKGVGTKTEAMPVLTYENQWIRVFGPSIDFKLGATGGVSYELTARYSNPGYDEGDSSFLRGMDSRKNTAWLGGRAIWRNEVANVSAELLGDVSGHSKGQQFKIGVDRRFQFGAISLVPRAAILWQDRNYVDYYYGVKASEVRADRPGYAGSSGVSTEVGVRLGYALGERQTVFLDLSATALPSSIKDSPLVDRGTTSAARIGYIYRF